MIDSISRLTRRAIAYRRLGDTKRELQWLAAALWALRRYLAGIDELPLLGARVVDSPAPERPAAHPDLLRLLAAIEDRRVVCFRALRGTEPSALPADYDPDDCEVAIYDADGAMLGTEVRAAGVVTRYDAAGRVLA